MRYMFICVLLLLMGCGSSEDKLNDLEGTLSEKDGLAKASFEWEKRGSYNEETHYYYHNGKEVIADGLFWSRKYKNGQIKVWENFQKGKLIWTKYYDRDGQFTLVRNKSGGASKNMNQTMANFSEKCIKEEYDCDCYAKKVKEHFKTEEAYIRYYQTHDGVPDELVDKLRECSKNPDFDF